MTMVSVLHFELIDYLTIKLIQLV